MIRREPCAACPYRRDCPSGVWAPEEYEKLVDYDGETFEQPPGWFACHATEEHVCHGWAVVGGYDLLGLRMYFLAHPDEPAEIPEPFVPLFDTHLDAAMHGLQDVEDPTPEATAAIVRLVRKHPRLRAG